MKSLFPAMVNRWHAHVEVTFAGSTFHTLVSSSSPSLPARPSSIFDLVERPMPDNLG